MLRNYLIIAMRNMMRHPGYALINIAGLSIGLAAVVLVGLFVRHETGYDLHHPGADRIYRVLREGVQDGRSTVTEGASGALVPEVRESFPDVEEALRWSVRDVWVRVEDRVFRQALVLTEPPAFSFFDLPLVQGSPEALYESPGAIFLTESMSRKLFDNADPIGRTVKIEDNTHVADYIVQGVLKDATQKTSLRYDFIASEKGVGAPMWPWSVWVQIGWTPVDVYLRLRPDADVTALEQKLHDAFARNMGDEMASRLRYHLQPLTRRYLYSKADYGIHPTSFSVWGQPFGDIKYVQMSILVAGFILLIACVNFTNLATARSLGRSREVGMRKVVGARRSQIAAQFLGEAVLVSLIAMAGGLLLAQAFLPVFNGLVDRSLSMDPFSDGGLVAGLCCVAIATGLISGIYPALVLSGFQPATVLAGVKGSAGGNRRLRKALVVSQFAISTALIIATIVAHQQLDYIRTRDLGFDREQVLIVPIFWEARNDPSYKPNGMPLKLRYQDVKRAFLDHPNALKAGTSRFHLQEYTAHVDLRPEGLDRAWRSRIFSVDESFFDMMDISFVAGRPFTAEYASRDARERQQQGEPDQFIINETAARQLGWDNPVGKTLNWDRSDRPSGIVIGVVKDFHLQTLHTPVEPVVFNVDHWNMKLLFLKVKAEGIAQTVAHLEAIWKRYLPGRPFWFEFLDQKIDSFYRAEQKEREIFQTFAIIAVFVACLGLLGLAAFTTVQRTKEICIRKVLGASEWRLVAMLAGEFAKLVIFANLIGWPVAWFAMRSWLDGFAYRVEMGAWPFALSGAIALILAFLTVSYQAWKVARTNPIDSLRHE